MKLTAPVLSIAALIGLSTTGCYSTWDIAPSQLTRLDGYRAPAEARLRDKEGASVEIDADSKVILHRGDASIEEQFVSVRTNGPLLTGVRKDDHQPVYIDLRGVERAEVKRFSTGKTVGLVIGVTLGTAAVATVIAGAVAASNIDINLSSSRNGTFAGAPHGSMKRR